MMDKMIMIDYHSGDCGDEDNDHGDDDDDNYKQ